MARRTIGVYTGEAGQAATQAAEDAAANADTAAARANSVSDQVEAIADALADGPLAADQRLREWTEAESYEVTSINRDADVVVTTATVSWPDGGLGTFITTTKNDDLLPVDDYTTSYTESGKTVTQAEVTRDGDGNVLSKPSLTVS